MGSSKFSALVSKSISEWQTSSGHVLWQSLIWMSVIRTLPIRLAISLPVVSQSVSQWVRQLVTQPSSYTDRDVWAGCISHQRKVTLNYHSTLWHHRECWRRRHTLAFYDDGAAAVIIIIIICSSSATTKDEPSLGVHLPKRSAKSVSFKVERKYVNLHS